MTDEMLRMRYLSAAFRQSTLCSVLLDKPEPLRRKAARACFFNLFHGFERN